MLIYAIDDERNALSIMLRAVEEAEPSAEVRGFSRSAELLSAMEERPCDVVFLDVEMPGLSGVALAKRLKAIHPKVNVIFATGYDQYKGAAMDLRASGYLMKPVTAEDVRTELDNLRHPVPAGAGKRVRFRTFGNFEVFIDGHNVSFRYDKTLELLDTPGILWPKFEDVDVGIRLAFTGAIRDEVMDIEELAMKLMDYLGAHYPAALTERYKITVEDGEDGWALLNKAGRKRGFLISGGEVDTERMSRILLDEFRGGKLGRFTLETPPEE